MPPIKPGPAPAPVKDIEDGMLSDRAPAAAARFEQAQAREQELLTLLQKTAPKDTPGLLALLPSKYGAGPIAFNPAADVLAAGVANNLHVWDLKERQRLRSMLGPKGQELKFAFSPDGKLLAAAGSEDRMLKVFDSDSGDEVKSLPLERPLQDLAFSADGKLVTAVLGEAMTQPVLRVWDLPSWQVRPVGVRLEPSSRATLSSDGSLLAVTSAGPNLTLYDLTTNTKKQIALKEVPQGGVAISPDGRFVSLAFTDAANNTQVALLDVQSGESKTLAQEAARVEKFQFAPGGKYLLYHVSSPPSPFKLLEIESGKERWSMAGNPLQVPGFSPGGLFLARGMEQGVQLFAVAELTAPR
jgi:WD40 repeat protein